MVFEKMQGEKMKIKLYKCKQCKKKIETRLILCCSCGQFCSKYCQDVYHEENYKKVGKR